MPAAVIDQAEMILVTKHVFGFDVTQNRTVG